MKKPDLSVNQKNIFIILLFFLIFSALALFSIYRIIVQATYSESTNISSKLNKIQNSEVVRELDKKIYSRGLLNYKTIQRSYQLINANKKFYTDNNITEIKRLPEIQKDKAIRLELITLKYDYIITQLTHEIATKQSPILYNIWNLLYAFLTWFSIIFANKFAHYISDFLIRKLCRKLKYQ